MKIEKVIIKGASGFGCVNDAYEDKLTITACSITYEYKSHPMSKLPANIYRKWSYKTNSPMFAEIYDEIAVSTWHYLHNDEELMFIMDIGTKTIAATFEDKHRESEVYYCPSEYFKGYFMIIRKLIPPCEEMPTVLWLPEDD